MIKTMKIVTAISIIALILFSVLFYFSGFEVFKTLAITSGTVLYHFGIRLFVGTVFDRIFKNRFDFNKFWFKEKAFEAPIYKFLKVKNWKAEMPTANPELFDIKNNGLHNVASAMCQAELIHEINVVLSFVPILATIFFGDFWVFFITSLLSACYDMIFVIMQRFNRPRIIRIANRITEKENKNK